MATNTLVATQTQEVLEKKIAPLKVDLSALQTQMAGIQESLDYMTNIFKAKVTQKAPKTRGDLHQEETSFSKFDTISSLFQHSQSHSTRDVHHGHRGLKLDMHKFDGNDPEA